MSCSSSSSRGTAWPNPEEQEPLPQFAPEGSTMCCILRLPQRLGGLLSIKFPLVALFRKQTAPVKRTGSACYLIIVHALGKWTCSFFDLRSASSSPFVR